MGREQEEPPSVSRNRQRADDSNNPARSDADPRYASPMPEARPATKEAPRPAVRSQTFHRASTHKYSPRLPTIPARLRQEPAGDRSHPCGETPHGATHRWVVQYDWTTEPGGLDRVLFPRIEAPVT